MSAVLSRVWRFVRPLLIAIVAVLGLVALSFAVRGPFSLRAYSDRLFWAGIIVIVSSLPVGIASLGSYSTSGTPSVMTAGPDARIAHARIAEYMRANAKRYLLVVRIAPVGIACVGLSALIEVLTR